MLQLRLELFQFLLIAIERLADVPNPGIGLVVGFEVVLKGIEDAIEGGELSYKSFEVARGWFGSVDVLVDYGR